ncbi:MAG: hypothetical protein M1829_000142 [Trizodia sp. TS-e1964]|nr:MAG: hypothetical protein M1829_000142 [Trizodia sp. TS-e1964]
MLLPSLLSSMLLLAISVSALPVFTRLQQRDDLMDQYNTATESYKTARDLRTECLNQITAPCDSQLAAASAARSTLDDARRAILASSSTTADEKYAVQLSWQQDGAADLIYANSNDADNESKYHFIFRILFPARAEPASNQMLRKLQADYPGSSAAFQTEFQARLKAYNDLTTKLETWPQYAPDLELLVGVARVAAQQKDLKETRAENQKYAAGTM